MGGKKKSFLYTKLKAKKQNTLSSLLQPSKNKLFVGIRGLYMTELAIICQRNISRLFQKAFTFCLFISSVMLIREISVII